MRALRLFCIVAVWLLSACLNAWAIAALYFDFSRAGRRRGQHRGATRKMEGSPCDRDSVGEESSASARIGS
jgi:hypothetical protein